MQLSIIIKLSIFYHQLYEFPIRIRGFSIKREPEACQTRRKPSFGAPRNIKMSSKTVAAIAAIADIAAIATIAAIAVIGAVAAMVLGEQRMQGAFSCAVHARRAGPHILLRA